MNITMTVREFADEIRASKAAAWEDAYALGYADRDVGAAPSRRNPHKDNTPVVQ